MLTTIINMINIKKTKQIVIILWTCLYPPFLLLQHTDKCTKKNSQHVLNYSSVLPSHWLNIRKAISCRSKFNHANNYCHLPIIFLLIVHLKISMVTFFTSSFVFLLTNSSKQFTVKTEKNWKNCGAGNLTANDLTE